MIRLEPTLIAPPETASIGGRLLQGFARRSERRRRFRQLLAELRSYSRSELYELGIDPSALEELAWTAARVNR